MESFVIVASFITIMLTGLLALGAIIGEAFCPHTSKNTDLIRECQVDLPRSKKCKLIAVEATDNTQEIK